MPFVRLARFDPLNPAKPHAMIARWGSLAAAVAAVLGAGALEPDGADYRRVKPEACGEEAASRVVELIHNGDLMGAKTEAEATVLLTPSCEREVALTYRDGGRATAATTPFQPPLRRSSSPRLSFPPLASLPPSARSRRREVPRGLGRVGPVIQGLPPQGGGRAARAAAALEERDVSAV